MNSIDINYIEFKVRNIERSKAFYTHLGWVFIDYGPSYCEFNSGSIKGGFYQVDTLNSQGGALIILYSKDLESTLTTLQTIGAIITSDIMDFPGGRRFHFQDLDGYELAVWSDL